VPELVVLKYVLLPWYLRLGATDGVIAGLGRLASAAASVGLDRTLYVLDPRQDPAGPACCCPGLILLQLRTPVYTVFHRAGPVHIAEGTHSE
jgi:hypothetical protein